MVKDRYVKLYREDFYKLNIILNDSNTNIGGIEVLFLEIAKYLAGNGNRVYFLVGKNNSIYEKTFGQHTMISFIRKKKQKSVEFYSDKELLLEKEFIISQLSQDEEFSVISPYFQALQYAMAVFGDNKRFKLMHLWSHPQSWVNQLSIKKTKTFKKKKNKTTKYLYQKKLIEYLKDLEADYYGARVVPVFNSWFYEINLDPLSVETLPIEDVDTLKTKTHSLKSQNTISVLWCGRFAYFKNEAIIHIHKTLEELALNYPDKKFSYGIIGFGDEKNSHYIKNNIKPNRVKVKYLGKVDPKKLINIFHTYDIGVGMGLTVKKMGQVGLPSIVIDSFEPDVEHNKNANWLFETSEGDAGDGYYFRIAEKTIPNRKELFDLLNEIASDPAKLELYSNKCIHHVKENYSFDKQIQAILTTAQETKFYGKSYPIYRRNFFVRSILNLGYYFYKKIKS